ANSSSKAAVSPPKMYQPLSSVRVTAASISARRAWVWPSKSTNGIEMLMVILPVVLSVVLSVVLPVVALMLPVVVDHPGQAHVQRRQRLPTQRGLNARIARIDIADVDPFALLRPGHQPDASLPGNLHDQMGQFQQGDRRLPAQVVDLAIGRVRGAHTQ